MDPVQKESEAVVKSAEDMLAQLRTFNQSEQVRIFNRIKDGLVNMREVDFAKLQAEISEMNHRAEDLLEGTKIIGK